MSRFYKMPDDRILEVSDDSAEAIIRPGSKCSGVEIVESVHERSPGLESDKLEELNHTLRVLEKAMSELK